MDDYEQPRCPECGTVLHTVSRGYECRGCDVVYLPTVGLLFPDE